MVVTMGMSGVKKEGEGDINIIKEEELEKIEGFNKKHKINEIA